MAMRDHSGYNEFQGGIAMGRFRWVTGIVFWALETFLYLDMLFFDFLSPGTLFQYLSIVLCIVFLFVNSRNTKAWWAITLAFFPSLVADWLLVIRQSHQILATGVFTLTQSAFAFRLFWEKNLQRGRWGRIYLFLVIGFEVCGWIILGTDFDSLAIITLLYFSLLLGNVIHSLFRSPRSSVLFSTGLVMFALCDIIIGMQNGTDYLPIQNGSFMEWILRPGFPLAWMFYLPAQSLIATSAVFERGNSL